MSRKGQWVAVLALAFAAAAAPTQAAMMTDGGALAGAPLTQKTQFDLPFPNPLDLFFVGGHDYCWYDDGWRGPAWYWCGYGERNGYGYGGGEGFHGWSEHRYERDWRGHGGGGGGERRRHDMDGGEGGGGGGGGERHHHEMNGGGAMQHQQMNGGGAMQHQHNVAPTHQGNGGGGGGNHPGGGNQGHGEGGDRPHP